MTYGFYIFICPALLIIQTVIFPKILLLNSFYDIVIPFIIFLGLNRPVRESTIVILILGLMMDCLSGTPFMLYVSAYFWLYVIVQVFAKIIQDGTRFRIPFLVSLGVVIQNLIFQLIITLADTGTQLPAAVLKILIIQVLWAFCTGTVLMALIRYTYAAWKSGIRRLFLKKGSHIN